MGYNTKNQKFADALAALGLEMADLELPEVREYSSSVYYAMHSRPLTAGLQDTDSVLKQNTLSEENTIKMIEVQYLRLQRNQLNLYIQVFEHIMNANEKKERQERFNERIATIQSME